ncbi:sugar phosphate isomerase/epimerase family protein [Chachezhania antarctica]|uniref:sugar phosphate isomerase/epimerase family protein n=1 Tax=Chachezhania antarctica TaxID=2340860 RepID=UPI000EB56ACE|nr:sugar phosphate isomerase/epimerase [Chachezhania antarctica]|tara:strand:+ start:4288 stop:5133 length:846 start_codon:yes stop_codon:yes gene_type:complete
MKIGMCMFLWTTQVGPEHEALLADIRETGFDGVEIPIFDGVPEDYVQLGQMLDRLGLERTAVSALGDPAHDLISPDRLVRDAGVERMKWVLDCTAALGANTVSGPLHSVLGQFSGTGPTDDEMKRAVESQRRIAEHAAKTGVMVGLEALNRFECYLVNTMADLSALLAQVDHPNIRAMYDTFHANIEETEPIAALTQHADDVVHIHISENDRGVPGRGHIPWAETFAAIREIGYDDWLTIEAFGRGLPDLAAATKVWRDFAESPEAVYREGYAHIRAGLGD